MKKSRLWLLLVLIAASAFAGPGKARKFTSAQLNHVTRLVRQTEPSASGKAAKPGNYGDALNRVLVKKWTGSPNSTQSTVWVSELGQSINPFTVVGNGKTNLFANPNLNSVSFIRRGGPTDSAGPDGQPGNRLYFDLNTHGGKDGFWQISKGPVWKNDAFPINPDTNYGARHPQGVLWAPPGSTDTNQAVFFSQVPVLDGSNGGAWGGQGKGWQSLSANGIPKQTLTSSNADIKHYIGEGMEVTSTGKIFFVDPERDLATGSTVCTGRIIVYSMAYYSATNDWDSTTSFLPFNAIQIAASSVAFGPDGTTGFVVVLATNPDFGITTVFAPFVSRTTDGGVSWSEFQVVDVNPESSITMDSIRDHILGSWVNFRSDGAIVAVPAGSPYSHKVQYSTAYDLDITVDKFNYCHLFTELMVAGFTDTLEASDPPFVRPGLGQWLVDFYLNDPDYPSAFVFDQANALRGCWGDCAGAENFTEDNRPQTTRTWDGSVIGFCYFDTDTAEFEPVEGNDNSNPDMWVRLIRTNAPGEYFLTSQVRNKTKGSSCEGQVVCGNVSPYMLPSPLADSTFIIPVSSILLSTFDLTTSPWPVSHLYLDGIAISSKVDSFPLNVNYHFPGCCFTCCITCDTVGLNDIMGNEKMIRFELLPIPAGNSILIQLSTHKPAQASFTLTNSLGQVTERTSVLVSEGDNRIPFNTSAYKPGIYFLHVSVGDQRVSKRFVRE